ncbi:MAG: hypothetical protein HRU10_01065 [Opitutales bacterium]|nr:hypothetical protein [Opitutales bacterium]
MQSFADQCLYMAQTILGHNIDSIASDGSISPVEGENSRNDEPGHAALALGEYFRATGQSALNDVDIVDLSARCITAQVFNEEHLENGLAYSALGLLSFGPSKDRNQVWERLLEPTREELDRKLLERSDYVDHYQAFNIAKAVTRYSLGLSKKDETGKLIDRFLERLTSQGTGGYLDDKPSSMGGFGGVFDIYGVMSFVFIRQALQLHANMHLRERKLPSLRTSAEKYIKLLPDMVRQDGLGWAYGTSIGAYGQMHLISLLLQALRDNWFSQDQIPLYSGILRRLFFYFFATYIDQEHGFLVIRDNQRNTIDRHTTRMANFDAARYLCQWSRLAKSLGDLPEFPEPAPKRASRLISFDRSQKKEHCLFIYKEPNSGLALQLPLVGKGNDAATPSLAFPHCPGIFDHPAQTYLPIMVPELTFGEHVTVPSFYGKRCTTGLGLRQSVFFRYEQPELITVGEKMVNGLGSCKVNWTFAGTKITCEFLYQVRQQFQLDRFRYMLAIAGPHQHYQLPTTFTLGAEGLRAQVVKDDFQAVWGETEDVTEDPAYRTVQGNVYYLQTLQRDHPLIMRPGQQYRLSLEFEPDIAFAGE